MLILIVYGGVNDSFMMIFLIQVSSGVYSYRNISFKIWLFILLQIFQDGFMTIASSPISFSFGPSPRVEALRQDESFP